MPTRPSIAPSASPLGISRSATRHQSLISTSRKAKAIGDKVDRYGAARNACWLVVYLNIDEWGIRQTQIEQVIIDTIFRYRDRFENLSVLWKGKLYSASEMP
jgi:hypothetical protein